MPVHDLFCPACGKEAPNTHLRLLTPIYLNSVHDPVTLVGVGYVNRNGVEWPLHCGQPMDYHPSRTTGFSAYDVNAGFDITVEDVKSESGQRVERVSSISDIRRIEKESEQRARNGEGRPFRWRDYSQDTSNKDQNTFGSRETVAIPDSARKNIRKGQQVATDHAE